MACTVTFLLPGACVDGERDMKQRALFIALFKPTESLLNIDGTKLTVIFMMGHPYLTLPMKSKHPRTRTVMKDSTLYFRRVWWDY
jgi:hypothetical protein